MNERIIIVEDDPAISKLIDTNLALSGYQTFCAMDGRQAVEAMFLQRQTCRAGCRDCGWGRRITS